VRRPRRAWLRAALLAVALGSLGERASAHSVDAATLKLTEVAPGEFAIDWQTLSPTLAQLREPAIYPKHCREQGARLDCAPLGLVGELDFPWLHGGESRVTVVVDWLSGKRLLRVADGRATGFRVYGVAPSSGLAFLRPIATDYTLLGIEHILTGFDHLLFVLAIALLVDGRRALLGAITAFTLAHSLTLAATVLGWLHLPEAVVETTIALSIVLACAECLRPEHSLARRRPWLVTFAFGLLHGAGFASALLEAGLPEEHVPTALLFFNVGVEVGQVAALAAFLGAAALAARWKPPTPWQKHALVYAIGCTAAYWSLERGARMF
jgi:hydrogenase/urease accessory protein HupE